MSLRAGQEFLKMWHLRANLIYLIVHRVIVCEVELGAVYLGKLSEVGDVRMLLV